jgi:CubicO group peptidase (beta-lactamase class C family)
MRHGKLVFEEYFWGYRRELAHAIASATKSVASILVGAAVDAGKLNIDSLVADHYPAYRGRRWQREGYPIRVRDLLSMTAGLEWTDRSAADQYTQRLLASDDPVGFVFDLARAEPPGARYNYNNGLPVLLGPILSQATGETVDAFADRVLFAPLGIRNYAWAALRDDKPLLTGGMRMPARDMAKLGQLMLDGGVWNGKRVVSRDWVALATARQTPQGQYPYGYFWHLSDPGQPWRGEPPSYLGPIDRYRAFMALGQGGQAIVVLPEADVVIVVVSSNWVPGMSEAFPTRLINKYIIPAIG